MKTYLIFNIILNRVFEEILKLQCAKIGMSRVLIFFLNNEKETQIIYYYIIINITS
jgi:hypothetical protein